MKKFIKNLFYLKFTIIFLILVSFTLGYLVSTKFINNNFAYYKVELTTDNNDFFNLGYYQNQYNKILDYNENHKNDTNFKSLYTVSELTGEKLYQNSKIENENNCTYILTKYKLFETSFLTKSQKVNEGKNKFLKVYQSFFNENISDIQVKLSSNVSIDGYQNPYIIGSITTVSTLVILLITLIIISCKDININGTIEYDNKEIFRTPFHKEYWKNSLKCFKNIKSLASIAILFALLLLCKGIKIPSGFGSLGIGLTYLVFAIISMIYGPVCGITVGILEDILGHFLFPDGYAFFPGYILDAMAAGFIYGIAFYKTKISFQKCFFARLFVNFIINLIFGSIWWAIINNFTYDAFISYVVVISLPKQLIYLIPQSIVLFIVLKSVAKVAQHFGIIDERITSEIKLI